MTLDQFVEALIDDKDLRREFVADPRGVIGKSSLSPPDRKVLLSMSAQEVEAAVSDPAVKGKIRRFNVPPEDFPPANDAFLAELGGLEPQYPTPAPGIFRYRIHLPFSYQIDSPQNPGGQPKVRRGFCAHLVNATPTKEIELTVHAQSYVDAELRLERTKGGAGSAVLKASSFFVMGTLRNTILRAVFAPPESASNPAAAWTPHDEFTVTVINLNGDPNPGKNTKTAATPLCVFP